MLKASVLCLTLVFMLVCVYAGEPKSNKPAKEQDLNKDTRDTEVGPDPSNARPRDQMDHRLPEDLNSPLGYRLSSSLEEKRGKNFGFVGSRGRRGDTLEDALFGEEFPGRRPMEGNARLRMLLGKHHQGLFAKEKRKPHFGFHGSRG